VEVVKARPSVDVFLSTRQAGAFGVTAFVYIQPLESDIYTYELMFIKMPKWTGNVYLNPFGGIFIIRFLRS